MTIRKEREYLLQQASRGQLLRGSIDRREFITRSLVAGLGIAGVGTIAKSGIGPAFAQDRPLTPTFYQWIEDLHPNIPTVNGQFPGINYQIAPVEGFGIERFVAEAKDETSTWDVYVGQTPFVEMSAMIEADVIEPWDDYIPKDVLDDIIPSIREECTINGKLYGWPFLLDVIGNSWHSGLTTQAVSNIIADLLEDGLIVEQGRHAAGRGLPAVQYALNASGGYALGVGEVGSGHEEGSGVGRLLL